LVSERKIRRLVERAKKYDPEAFSELYELYIRKIYRYILFRVGDPHH